MIELTPDAKRRFEDYLRRMRRSLTGSRSVAADEVEQDVVQHVELALGEVAAPVGLERLDPVLAQLGPPERWLPEEERPVWRRVMDRVVHGPEDWRLPYLSFALTFLMVVFFPVGGVLLLVPAFLVSRAFVELMNERGEALGARRWLVLPPIVFLLLLLSAGALIGAAGPIAAIALENDAPEAMGFTSDTRLERIRVELGFVSLTAGAWWILLSGIVAMLMRPFRALFLPLTTGLRRGHALVLTLAGIVVGGIGVALLWL